jgi:aryl-alcohol dehydrogenase
LKSRKINHIITATMVSAQALVLPELHAPFQVLEVELDNLRPDEVLVEMKATSICATDPAVQHGKIPQAFPVVLGHEGISSSSRVQSQFS